MDRNIPDHVVQTVYGRMGFSAESTEILAHDPPYVLLAFPMRETQPYSIVNLRTRLTEQRFDEPAEAQQELERLASATYRFRPPEEM